MRKVAILAILALLTGVPWAGASPIPPRPELWVMDADGTGQRPLSGQEDHFGYGDGFSWSPDSTRLVVDGLAIFDVASGARTELGGGNGRYPDWSPVSDEIVFSQVTSTETSYDEELYVIGSDGSGLRLLVDTPEFDGPSSWSPDGTKVAFISGGRDGERGQVYVVNADGTGLRQLSTVGALYVAPEWSPDGRELVFETFEYKLYQVDADGTDERPVVPYGSRYATWCPDGTLYFVGDVPAEPGPFIQSRRGDQVAIVTRGYSPDCGPFGKLAFSRADDIHVLQPGEAGTPNLTDSEDRSDTSSAWSPDGTKIAFSSTPHLPPPTRVEPSLTLSLRKHLTVRGRLIVPDEGFCLSKVRVQKLRQDGWTTVEKISPDRDGGLGARIPDRAGFYRLVAPHRYTVHGTHECLRAVSNIDRHRH